ncbi:metal ABC transporter ATP-binding protein [Patescibacteria group bacterium]|nr:MAG: metal ABC transporter ATP-binding protein [Patescibacteria group bacterium]
MPFLAVHELSVRYGETRVLERVSFEVEQGELVAIIGPNGSGKTTLIRAILGLAPAAGEVLWEKPPTTGYVPQRVDFDPSFPLTVEELLLLRLVRHRFWRHDEQAHEAITHALKDVGAAKLVDKPIGVLSGGELQRVLIANALIANPTLLVLDEPASGIDIEGEETIYGLIHRLAEERHMTVLLVSHDLDIVFRYASKVVCVNRKLICQGAPSKVLTAETLSRAYATPARYLHAPGERGNHRHHG